MTALLLFGFLVGMRHALDADHVAAIASLATGSQSVSQSLRQGVVWGIGHTTTLLIIGCVVLLLGGAISTRLATLLELAVGIMLVGLGLNVIRRLRKDNVHFHYHVHQNGEGHMHAHGHHNDTNHAASCHKHLHPERFPVRALYVGFMHGLAGSAVLIVQALSEVQSPLLGLCYIALFGVGSILGMGLLTLIISIPLRRTASGLTFLHTGMHAAVGLVTVAIGGFLIFESGASGLL